jgi:hypothetical protein
VGDVLFRAEMPARPGVRRSVAAVAESDIRRGRGYSAAAATASVSRFCSRSGMASIRSQGVPSRSECTSRRIDVQNIVDQTTSSFHQRAQASARFRHPD